MSPDPFVVDPIDQLLDHMNAQAPGFATACGLGLGRGCQPRIELPPVIDDLHFYSILLSGDPHA